MFNHPRKAINCGIRLAARNLSYRNVGGIKDNDFQVTIRKLHTTTMRSAYALLPLPNNIDAAETTRFSPHRSRDIAATTTVITSQSAPLSNIDITADNSAATSSDITCQDPHVQSYDCFGAISLNAVMQSNVPQPFGGKHKFSHLNMPGGQWAQDCKFVSQNLQSSHYTALRDSARSGWLLYNENATVGNRKEHVTNCWSASLGKRSYCTNADKAAKVDSANAQTTTTKVLTKREQLKKAFTEYGTTVVVFHVAISLVSLGGCYVLVSGGIDMMPVLEYLGLASSALSNKIATGASTFVVAYAIHKVFAPVRISITLGATPFIVRYLRSKGFLKAKIVKQK